MTGSPCDVPVPVKITFTESVSVANCVDFKFRAKIFDIEFKPLTLFQSKATLRGESHSIAETKGIADKSGSGHLRHFCRDRSRSGSSATFFQSRRCLRNNRQNHVGLR